MIDNRFHNNADEVTISSYDCADKIFYDPNKPRIVDILWNNYDWVFKTHKEGRLRDVILDNIQKTLICKSPYLGYDAFDCTHCDNWIWLFRHCHSRFCPSCGIKMQKQLAVKAEVMCIDVKHRHIVFTIPLEYREYFRKDRDALNILFVASRNTLMKMTNSSLFNKIRKKKGIVKNPKDNYYLFRNYKHLNHFGMISTLHTFGRDLKWNPHIHALVPELIYNSKNKSINHYKHFNYESLRKTWMYEVNRLLLERFKDNKKLKAIINNSYKTKDNGFYVYAKANLLDDDRYNTKINSKNIKGCVNYMMRYAGRPAMAESRIVSYDSDNDDVSWFYEDHKTNQRVDISETGLDLLKKMIIHIPEKDFKMVRYYGFYNNKCQDILDEIHKLLGSQKKTYRNKEKRKRELKAKLNKLKFRTHLADTYNRDIFKCECGHNFYYVFSYNPLEGKSNDRTYRQNCIDEMSKMRLPRGSIRGNINRA